LTESRGLANPLHRKFDGLICNARTRYFASDAIYKRIKRRSTTARSALKEAAGGPRLLACNRLPLANQLTTAPAYGGAAVPSLGKKTRNVNPTILRTLRGAEAALEKLLPPLAYCRAQELIRPLLDSRVRGPLTRSVSRENGAFLLSWSDGTHFHFPHQHRYPRYMQLSGTEAIYEYFLDKYQDGAVQVPVGGVVVEAGAHCGEFTAAAARIASRVYSFDPDPQVQTSLRLNTQQFPNVEIFQVALGDADGEATFYLATAKADSSLFKPVEATEKVVVKVVRLESFVRERQLSSIDFLKVEAEGAEPEILQGCGDALKKVRQVAIDCGPERYGQTTFAECEEILGKAGFETWRGRGGYNTLFGLNPAA